MPSFDIVSKTDLTEVDNALRNIEREIATRFDFKGSQCRIERLESTSTILGAFKEWECGIEERPLSCGDTLVLYTDGVTESFNDADEEFGERRLIEALRRCRQMPPQALMEAIVDEVRQFSPGVPKALFDSRASGGGGSGAGVTYNLYAPIQNGDKFLFVTARDAAEVAPITVVLDWTGLLKK